MNETEWNEFKLEAEELLDAGEKSLLAVAEGQSFVSQYDTIFRTFHNIKGVAGMIQLVELRDHMHHLENILNQHKNSGSIGRTALEQLLQGIDCARSMVRAPKEKPTSDTLIKKKHEPGSEAEQSSFSLRESLGRVLVIDDSKATVNLIRTLLDGVGFEVVGEEDPIRALELLPKFAPHVIFTDLIMPGLSGTQVLEGVRKFDPDLPVIYVSGQLSKKSLLEAISLGVYGAIEKPFAEADVIQLAMAATRHYRLIVLLNKSLQSIMYHYSLLDDFLQAQGKNDIRSRIAGELDDLLSKKNTLQKSKA